MPGRSAHMPYASLTHIGRSITTKEETDLPKDSKKLCIHGSTSKEDLDKNCYSDTYFDKGRSGASTLETVFGEYRSSDNIHSDDILVPPKKVPPDLYDRDNPVSTHRLVDGATLCNDRLASFEIPVYLKPVAAVFGVTDNLLDKDVIFNAGSEQLKVTTNLDLNVAAARSIGNGAKHTQNAVFDDDDPKSIVPADRLLRNGAAPNQNATFDDDDPNLDDPTTDVPDSIPSLFDNVEKTIAMRLQQTSQRWQQQQQKQ